MTRTRPWLGCLLAPAALVVTWAAAQEEPPSVDLESGEVVSLESELPIELDTIEVTGQRIPVRQEAGLRLVRQAMKRPRSRRPQDIDELVCWLESPIGTRIKYLYCARNGDLWAREPEPLLDGGSGYRRQVPGYGKLMRSDEPMTRRKLDLLLGSLNGSDDLDGEFVAMALSGRETPQDIPDDEELDRFARAYYTVEKLHSEGVAETEQEAAIAAEGLSLARYNRLIELVQIYQSLENEVAIRLNDMRGAAE
jgi:hypothetical protein